jgi:hypothetical protein
MNISIITQCLTSFILSMSHLIHLHHVIHPPIHCPHNMGLYQMLLYVPDCFAFTGMKYLLKVCLNYVPNTVWLTFSVSFAMFCFSQKCFTHRVMLCSKYSVMLFAMFQLNNISKYNASLTTLNNNV